MAFPLFVVFGFITKPLTINRLFAELFGHYRGLSGKKLGGRRPGWQGGGGAAGRGKLKPSHHWCFSQARLIA
jgi:hypothetical protein